jgi:hypothetical protein
MGVPARAAHWSVERSYGIFFEQQKLYFKVTADYGKEIINSDYGVTCSEGVIAYGDPVTTGIKYNNLYLPIIYR